MILIVLPDVTTDARLLLRVRAGDEDAIISVYQTYLPPLYQYVRLRVGDNALAEDIVSDIFVKLIDSIGKASAPHSSLRGWLFRVARSEIAQHYGEKQHLSLTNMEEWLPASSITNPETQVMETGGIERVRQAVRMLKAEHQEVLILRFGQVLSLQETADIMGKSISAIKSLQFRALATLRQILDAPYPEVNHG